MMEYFNSIFSSAKPLLFNVLLLFASVLAGAILQWAIFKWLKFRNRKKKSGFIKEIIQHLAKPTKYFLPIWGVYATLHYLQAHGAWKSFIEILLIVNFAWLLQALLEALTELVKHKFEIDGSHKARERKVLTQLKFIKNITLAVIVTLTFAILLQYIPGVKEIGKGLLTSAGVMGIIVGIAAQKTIANLIAGFQIAFTQPVKIDDVVIVEGEWGTVEDITLTYVVVKTWDWRRLVLPLNYFNEKPFENWTLNSTELTGSIFLYVDYTFPVQILRGELERILKEHPLWDKKIVSLLVTKSNERTLELRAAFSAKNSSDVWAMRCEIREKLIAYIQENYGESLPQVRAQPFLDNVENHPAE